jgi:hypothetical protein
MTLNRLVQEKYCVLQLNRITGIISFSPSNLDYIIMEVSSKNCIFDQIVNQRLTLLIE